ncbi:nicotinate-nucleotide--dimethylbenzimidazole phosphoribosyltransferase [Desulfatirhabdium butyrativorans]|uniref:nicotinate-nucleotide--dimethylbenzimidazole phosphoribosyltransferase n=1 Tax=Desulfatirhabdium butyrativorans TaxID=340467 RepID=UPI0004822143|nr:nicotinate-nucleotide--dimethylbenzimidazole phosphoribosyltransferase [Desulfatirhabdium butyrativorans]
MNNPSSLKDILASIQPVDPAWIEKAKERTAQLVMPPRALGRLHDFSERLCAIQKTLEPTVSKKAIAVMAGDHGIASESVSAFPQEVTGAMVKTFLAGGAGINALAGHVGADVRVIDMGIIPEIDPATIPGGEALIVRKIRKGTDNFLKGPAMSRQEAEQSILAGFEVASSLYANGYDILGTGDMGIGNTSPSAAIGAVLSGCGVDVMTGPGTGLNAQGLAAKRAVLAKAIAWNRPDPADGIDVLAKVGGFEIGGIAGLILAAAFHQKPIVIDGFISTAGALIAHSLCPAATDYLFSGHCSEEPGHRFMLDHLQLRPILDLGMRLGEGTGAALAMCILDASAKMFRQVMTFAQAQVSGKA